jgi:hypothetical protein
MVKLSILNKIYYENSLDFNIKIRFNTCGGRVAQSVEQWIENPRVGGSIPPLTTTSLGYLFFYQGIILKS